ncbi:DUF418 domain-containing protein [Mesobacillus harenae]|uniref:DUF418 domain-containing protein n=1 Tax=Mesobacillus harenae TaxID=2213203 RepID=UPI00158073FB|nr:DUF418 domain-containing protein [Mesobacillus harenae]
MNQNSRATTKRRTRLLSLDLMRGIALLGILLVNMISFHAPFLYIDPLAWWSGDLNHYTYIFIDVFIQASFYPLFALLFGYSIVLFQEGSLAKGLQFYRVAVRRLLFLLIIGIIHMVFVWHGDILITYAICGLLLLLFLRLSSRGLVWCGILLYSIPNLLFGLLIFAAESMAPSENLTTGDPVAASTSVAVYQNGQWIEIMNQRIHDWLQVNNPASFLFLILTILPLFLVGAGAAKNNWAGNFYLYKRPMCYVLIFLLPFGLLLKSFPYFFEQTAAADYFQDLFGGVFLAISYAISIAFLACNERVVKVIMPFAAVGRMSISNYLFQSVLLTTVFYGYGLGYYGKVSLFTGSVGAVLVFALQIILSNWWLNRYHFGPVEWVWRNVTYLESQKWRKKNK